MTDFEARLGQIEARLATLEARDEAMPGGLAGLLRELFPPEVRTHLRSARREQLLAARAFLDHWIERLEREPGDGLPRRETISID